MEITFAKLAPAPPDATSNNGRVTAFLEKRKKETERRNLDDRADKGGKTGGRTVTAVFKLNELI